MKLISREYIEPGDWISSKTDSSNQSFGIGSGNAESGFLIPTVGFPVPLRFRAGLETMLHIRPLRWPSFTLNRPSPLFPINKKAVWLELVPASVR